MINPFSQAEAKGFVAHLAPPGPQDFEPLGEPALAEKIVEGGNELSPGKVAASPEDDKYYRIR